MQNTPVKTPQKTEKKESMISKWMRNISAFFASMFGQKRAAEYEAAAAESSASTPVDAPLDGGNPGSTPTVCNIVLVAGEGGGSGNTIDYVAYVVYSDTAGATVCTIKSDDNSFMDETNCSPKVEGSDVFSGATKLSPDAPNSFDVLVVTDGEHYNGLATKGADAPTRCP